MSKFRDISEKTVTEQLNYISSCCFAELGFQSMSQVQKISALNILDSAKSDEDYEF